MLQFLFQLCKNTLNILHNVMVPEALDFNAIRRQISRTSFVVIQIFRSVVVSTVQFYRQVQ